MIPPTSHRQVFRCPQFSAIYAFLALYMRNVLDNGARAFIKSYFRCKVHILFRKGHKILQNLHSRFVPCSASKIYGGNFAKFVVFSEYMIFNWTKGQLISIWFLVSSNSSKKWTNEFFLLLWRLVFVRFLEEIEDTKNHFEIIWPLHKFH